MKKRNYRLMLVFMCATLSISAQEIENAGFDGGTKDGWTDVSGNCTVGGNASNPCVECYNANFNFYQTLTGLAAGAYEVHVQAFYRSGSNDVAWSEYQAGTADIKTVIYAGDVTQQVTNIMAEAVSNSYGDTWADYETSAGTHVPNNMASSSTAFTNGLYDNVVYGVVTEDGGSLTIGIRQTDGTASARWSIWDNFHIISRGTDAEAVKPALLQKINEALETKKKEMSADALSALEAAIVTAQTAANGTDGDTMFQVLVILKETIEAANRSNIAVTGDCTDLITNQNFTDGKSGWTDVSGNCSAGGSSTNPNIECYNANFDFYQTLSGLPAGGYEIRAQAFYRSGSNDVAWNEYKNNTADIKTVIYAGNVEQKVANLMAEAQTTAYGTGWADYETGDGTHVPNTMATASAAFDLGLYDNVVYGVVAEDGGSLTVGIRQTDGTADARWSIWDNFRIAYKGTNAETILPSLQNTIASAKATLEKEMDDGAKTALEAAIANAETAAAGTDGETMLTALAALNQAVIAAENSSLGQTGDYTERIENPNFDNGTQGWTDSTGKCGSGGSTTNPCVECYNASFDFYQDVKNLPAGAYELKMQAFYRTGTNDIAWSEYKAGSADIQTVIYAGQVEQPVANVMSDAVSRASTYGSGERYQTGDKTYVPNSMVGGSKAFTNGLYENSVYGVVTEDGGTLRIGIRNTTAVAEARWSLWDNARLIYKGLEAEYLLPTLQQALVNAGAIDGQPMNSDTQAELTKAISDGRSLTASTDGTTIMEAIKTLQTTTTAATKSISVYNDLAEVADQLTTTLGERYEYIPAGDRANAANEYTVATKAITDGSYTDTEAKTETATLENLISKLESYTLWLYGTELTASMDGTKSAKVGYEWPHEKIGRGVVAVPQTYACKSYLVSWRLLYDDDDFTTFDVLRNGTPIVTDLNNRTNYLDTGGSPQSVYQVVTKRYGEPVDTTAAVKAWNKVYATLQLDRPEAAHTGDWTAEYYPNDCSVGDVDRDGQYELFVKWVPTDHKDNSVIGLTSPTIIDCYKVDWDNIGDGKAENCRKMWRVNLGINIRTGEHYTQYLVYDFDGDGRSELICKTAPGTLDGLGKYVTEAADDETIKNYDNNADLTYPNGMVQTGPEYLTVFDGETGAAIHTVYYTPNRAGTTGGTSNNMNEGLWGDGWGNRGDRFLACVAFLRGHDQNPSAVMCRGYYQGAYLWAVNFDGLKLSTQWIHGSLGDRRTVEVTDANGNKTRMTYPEYHSVASNGNHNLSVADVDGDGCDEILYGAAAVNHDGMLLYSTAMQHGDAMHVGDFMPDRPGLEVFTVHESTGGCDIHDAATGELLITRGCFGGDTGRGMCADVDASHRGAEFWHSSDGNMYNVSEETVGAAMSYVFRIYWDGDLQDELLGDVSRHNSPYLEKFGVGRLFIDGKNVYDINGSMSINDTKGVPNLSCDLFGDWREEMIYSTWTDPSVLNVLSTSIESPYRVPTLMHDHTYRLAIAWQNVAYNQPPHIGYYLPDSIRTHFTYADTSLRYQCIVLGDSIQPVLCHFNGCNSAAVSHATTPDDITIIADTPDGFQFTRDTKTLYNWSLAGTPTQIGTYTFVIRSAGDVNGSYITDTITVDVVAPTGIAQTTVSRKAATGYIYTLDGRPISTDGKLGNLPRGIYIMNGKKVLKK